MQKKPKIAVVGRPNVGKSTLVNRIVGKRKSIVDDQEGVTRDRLYFDAQWRGRDFTIIDTGGIVLDSIVSLYLNVFSQVRVACEEADMILFVVNGNDGLNSMDEDIANILRKANKPVFLVVNKIDTPKKVINATDFYSLAMGNPWCISALHGSGSIGDLLDEVTKDFEVTEELQEPKEEQKEEKEQPVVQEKKEKTEKKAATKETETKKETANGIKIAIVGKPNVGKSSIVNALLNEERSIVADESGTTRDSINSQIKYNDQQFTLIDTAGIRKKSKVEWGVEMFAVDRAINSIRECDVAVLIIDVTSGITEQDKRIASTIIEAGKGIIIAFNKYDLINTKDAKTIGKLKKSIESEIPFFDYVPKIFISAKTRANLESIYKYSTLVYNYCTTRISTGTLNKVINDAFLMNPPSSIKGKMLKIYYTTQVKVAPPAFILFINNKTLIKSTYRKYIENALRTAFGFIGTPIKIGLKEKKDGK